MNPQDIFETISSQYFQLTNSEKKVADYILAHRIEAQYMSISELAEECEVADATISRFCRRLGLAGYNAFKLELAKASMATRTIAHPTSEAPSEMAGQEQDFRGLCQRRFHESVAAMEQTMKLLSSSVVNRVVDLFDTSKRIYCMGQGSSMVLAEEAWTMFSTVSSKFLFVPDSHLQMNALALMEENDLILFFSYSGSTKELQDILEVAGEKKVKVILVTRFPKSPGGQVADVVLQCGSNEGPLQAGSATARMAQLFVLDVLFGVFCERNVEQTTENRERIAEAVSRLHL